MSQNPNNNPYGQNPSDPNAIPGTAYGSPPPPPGANPDYGSYNPYPPNANPPTPAPGSGPASNPNYGPYNPYAPNPPTPPPTPDPATPNYTNYNPYDQYAPTVPQGANANYNTYIPPAPPAPPVPPTRPRSRGLSGRIILLAVLAGLLVIGGIAFGLVSYNNTQTANANATATAQANATRVANLTATANASATAFAIQNTYPFSANLKLNDPLTDNSKGYQWETSDFCKFTGSAYHVVDPQTNTYSPCAGINTDFSDFTFQVEMSISKGDGGGLIFRGNEAKSQYYRFAIYTDGTYGIYVYVDTTGQNARTLKSGNLGQTLNDTNTISVVARGETLALYVNQTEVTSVTDSTYTHGQIGFSATNLSHAADVIFTNAKVWALS